MFSLRIHSNLLLTRSQKERGMVLLLVLSIFSFAAIVSGELSYQSHREVRRTSNLIAIDEAYLFAKGGEAFAIHKLISDYLYDQRTGLKVDYLTEAWSIQSQAYELDKRQIDSNGVDNGTLVEKSFLKENSESEPLQDIGKMIIIIEDLQARFNINNIQYNTEGSIKGLDQFESLLNVVTNQGIQLSNTALDEDIQYQADIEQNLELETPPSDLARAVLDWIDKDDESQLPSGSEDSFYSNRKNAYRTASQDIADVSELMAITGFSENDFQIYNLLMPKRILQLSSSETESGEQQEDVIEEVSYDQYGNPIIRLIPAAEKYWGGVQNYLSALPFQSKINVNTASEKVLQALFNEEQSNIIVKYREESPYQKVEDIFLNIQSIKKQEDKNKYLPYLSVNSNYFLSTVITSIGETNFVLRSTLYRDDKGNIRVLKREFGR